MFWYCFCIVPKFHISLCHTVMLSNQASGYMAKKSTSTVKVSSTGKASILTKVQQAMSAALTKGSGKIAVLLMLITCGIIAACQSAEATGVSTAMLYMLAENGKKSGRADGNVYQRNGRIRGMAIPRLVQNSFTGAVRNSFASLSQAWRGLAEESQLTWISATSFFKTDRFGRSIMITGNTLYNWLNGNRVSIGLAPIDNCPAPSEVVAITIDNVTADVSAVSLDVTLNTDPVPAGTSVKIWATAPQGAGINRPSASKYRYLTFANNPDSMPISLWETYITRFGVPAAGQKIFLKAVAVNEATGLEGVPSLASVTVVA